MYEYFVSYRSLKGVGMIRILTDKKIDSYDRVRDVRTEIIKDREKEIIITNFILLKKHKKWESSGSTTDLSDVPYTLTVS